MKRCRTCYKEFEGWDPRYCQKCRMKNKKRMAQNLKEILELGKAPGINGYQGGGKYGAK